MRKISGLLQIMIGLLNIYFLLKYVLYMAKFDSLNFLFPPLNSFIVQGHFYFIDFLDGWYRVIGTTLSALFLFTGGISALKGKHWGLVLTGVFLILLTPIVYQRIDLSLLTLILCNVGLVLGIISIVLTILSRKEFNKKSSRSSRS